MTLSLEHLTAAANLLLDQSPTLCGLAIHPADLPNLLVNFKPVDRQDTLGLHRQHLLGVPVAEDTRIPRGTHRAFTDPDEWTAYCRTLPGVSEFPRLPLDVGQTYLHCLHGQVTLLSRTNDRSTWTARTEAGETVLVSRHMLIRHTARV